MNQTFIEAALLVLGVIVMLALWVEYRIREHAKLPAWTMEKLVGQVAQLEDMYQKTIEAGAELEERHAKLDRVTVEMKRQQQSDKTELHARITEMRELWQLADTRVSCTLLELSARQIKTIESQEAMRDDLGEYTEKLVATEFTLFADRMRTVEEALKIKAEIKPAKQPLLKWSDMRAAAEAGEARIRRRADENEARKKDPAVQ